MGILHWSKGGACMLNIDKKRCTGCGTCENVCSQNAIRMVESDRGFLYPAFDESLCIECGLCEKKCPLNVDTPVLEYKQRVYGAWSKDKKILKASSSGGVFVNLAKEVLKLK